MISRTVAQAIARDAIRLEAKNAKILRENLLAARTKLMKNPSKWQYEQFGGFIDEVMGEYEAAAVEQFPVEETLEHGQKEGQLFTGVDLDIPKDANYWQWKPTLPLNAISLAESDFAKLITNASSDFKKEALRTVQQGLAMGGSTQDLMDDLLGVGISGEKGRDGKFRKAVNRAEAIARTVSNDLINRGAMMTYEQIDRTSPELNLQKIWQTLSDNRTSERCLSLSGQVKELNENFQAGDGWIGKQPPAHPYCRSRVTSRAKNAKYTEEIDEKFKQQELAAIALQPEPTSKPEPLSEPLPTPKKEKKTEAPKVVAVDQNPSLKDSAVSFDIASEKKNLATMKSSDTGFGDPNYDVKNFVEYNKAKVLAKANTPNAIPANKKDVDNAIKMGLVPHDSVLGKVKLTKAQEQLLAENRAKLADAKKQIAEAEKILEKKSVKDPSKWKPTMTREEADEYFGEDNYFGQQSFWHGNSKAVTESIATEGGQPERNVRGMYGQGVYAGSSKGIGLTYGNPNTHDESELLEMRIYSKKPYIVDSSTMKDLVDGMDENGFDNDVRVLLKSKGFDSIYIKNTGYIVALDKEQIVVVDRVKLDKNMADKDTFYGAETKHISKFQQDLADQENDKIDLTQEYNDLQEDDDDFF